MGNNCHLQLQHTQLWSIVFHHLKKDATSVTDLEHSISGGFKLSYFLIKLLSKWGWKEKSSQARLYPPDVQQQTRRKSGYGFSILIQKSGRMLPWIYHPNWKMSYSIDAFQKTSVHLHTSAVSKLTAHSFQPQRQEAAAWSATSSVTELLRPVDWCQWARKGWQ